MLNRGRGDRDDRLVDKVMATAKIIAVRIRLRDWPPPVLLLIVPSLVVAPLS
jgi:hypothetical protein